MIGGIDFMSRNTDSKSKIVTFQDGTDEEISAMLEAHYAGKIDIADYWAVGDERTVHLNAMSAGTGANETHVAQDMVMTIIGINHDDLETPIGKRTKSAVTIQCRETLAENGIGERGYYWGSSVNSGVDTNYTQNPRRTWLNGAFISSMPTTFGSLVKTVVKKNISNHSDNPSSIETKDKAFLLSYPEVFGTASQLYYKGNAELEGNQYQYYVTASNRIKYTNNNGGKSIVIDTWWLRSPSSYSFSWYGYYWVRVDSSSTASDYNGSDFNAFAPAFCL